MTDRPTVLVPHLVMARGTEPMAEAIRDRLDDVDLRVATDEETALEHAPDTEVVVTHRLSDDLLDSATALRWVHSLTAGLDHFDLDDLDERGLILTNSSGIHAQPIGEHVLGALLHFERRFDRAVAQQHRREWDRFGATELADRTVAVVGVGAIGTRVVELCDAIGAETIGVKRDPSGAPDALADCVTPDRLHDALERADCAVLACPLTDETSGMIDAEALDALGDGVLVNIARGEVVDEAALIEALDSGELGGAALDVFAEEPLPEDSPLWGFENVLLTPHVAGTTPHYWERAADQFTENYHRYVAGKDLANRHL
ncbi:D-2-hydroxyacid dehydrogenase [Salinirubellus sp. GCM10025818]|uniref:D-2-hydroxyacid dehydrogenase n=1 Tax=Salinirubellus TaxID=2162630 RepID=UPI0030D245DB